MSTFPSKCALNCLKQLGYLFSWVRRLDIRNQSDCARAICLAPEGSRGEISLRFSKHQVAPECLISVVWLDFRLCLSSGDFPNSVIPCVSLPHVTNTSVIGVEAHTDSGCDFVLADYIWKDLAAHKITF